MHLEKEKKKREEMVLEEFLTFLRSKVVVVQGLNFRTSGS